MTPITTAINTAGPPIPVGSDPQRIAITPTATVTRAPAIRKIPTIRARAGTALHLTIQATGYPVPALTESGPLPRGLSFTDNGNGTALIAGTPAAGNCRRYRVTITATNTSGTAKRHFTIVVTQRRRR